MVVIEAILVAGVVNRLITNLDTLLQGELGIAWDLKRDMDKLKNWLRRIESVINAVSEQQFHNPMMMDWLQKLRDEADDANNFLSSLVPQDEGGRATNQVCLQLRNTFPFGNPYARKIKTILKNFEEIERLRNLFSGVGETKLVVGEEEETHPTLPLSEVYEREEAIEEIVELLINSAPKEDLSVIPIVGIRGIGKTTLAKLAYNDRRVEQHFKCGLRMWIWVSDDFDVKTIAQKIIQSVTKNPCEHLNLEATQNLLQEKLSGRIFLLVLDNVWNESGGKWEELQRCLKYGKHGSKVIVTTANERVAKIMKTTDSHHLKGLSESACWSIFKEKAFKGGRNNRRLNFVEIGREIAKKSRGVPMAAEALGRLMFQKEHEIEWLAIKNSEIWNLPNEENKILPALRSSYKHLPSNSKQCFAYCSIFPRDYEIEKEKLIKLWIANDFISPRGNKELEVLGHEIFNHLLSRFFFQDIKKDGNDSVTTFKMQGLIYDLARSEMGTACSVIEAGQATGNANSIHHLCCDVRTSPTIPEAVCNARSLRTLLLLNTQRKYINAVPNCIFRNFKRIRVLDLSFTHVTVLQISAGNLEHLRYLDLTGTNIVKLPNALCGIQNMQTLILRHCSKLTKLPADMKKMVSLRHLDIAGCLSLAQMPAQIGQLRCLQTLPMFIVSQEKRRRIKELEILNLKGELNITCLNNVTSVADAEQANLKEKAQLCSLGLSWKNDKPIDSINAKQVFEALQPHNILKSLHIGDYMGVSFPSWITASLLPNMVEIRLTNCRRCKDLPPLGELPLLKSLTIQGMDVVQYLGSKFYGCGNVQVFPSLEELTCTDMINLKHWAPERREIFPRLARLTIKKCPKLSNLPCLPSSCHLDLQENTPLLRQNLVSTTCRHIIRSAELESPQNGMQRMTNILKLEITDCPRLNSMKEPENLHAQKALKIHQCQDMLSVLEGLEEPTSLESLEVNSCHSLTSLPEKGLKGLHSLQSLLIRKCHNLTTLSEGLQHLTNLQIMTIDACPNLVSLPEGLRHLTRLRALSIHNCERLESLPYGLRNLTGLKDLEISDCHNLKHLPSGKKPTTELQHVRIWNCHGLIELPEWLSNLTSLRSLKISNCRSIKRIPAGLRSQKAVCIVIQDCPQLKE